ncbi:MAG: phosphoribosylformylglycinamidine synthase subunit PurQ [Chitinophagales bacterium]|nr:phosphoribosylformylglycinamidine synthase subunit PurQ [Chitinophagales bacterium]MCO5279524.1 phosphoribosylformylglycinamidine synthase subunit PurQ [Chitinophagales bacterium]OJV24252.1 MAG: phosphoribosylformylglycinamidine synthase I [Bacteroidetes bacterium 37-13]HRN93523.1 phosphoribosylformylglycinamidine synthase subunit PurQ [Chitinophagales bacterium]HRP39247.1 phosphoribosylformylglycinamidine synthase subunit PurQ [Chitinophagales bacterium]
MKFGVVVFPGSNCDKDMLHVLGNVMGAQVREIFHKETSIDDFSEKDCIVLPGGFSYGDYLRTGAIARFSPVMNAIIEFANAGGKVLGICNGFQVLCESHLLPGALLRNNNMQYICKNVHLKVETNNTQFTALTQKGSVLEIPIAHGEGRFYCDEKTLQELYANDQVLFKYCDATGNYTEAANPNGSIDNIAGITNKTRNVFGMMPHPERASELAMNNTDGRILFESLLAKAAVV